MRTTLTLEEDVASRLEKLRDERRDESFKDIVNDVMRRGLNEMARESARKTVYRTEPHSAGRCALPNVDSLHHTLVFGEGEAYR